MQIELSKKEYKNLIDMIQIAEWVMNAHKIKKDPSIEKYSKLEQKIYSFADKMGCENLIEYDKEMNEYFPTKELDEGQGMQYIDEYDNDSFWDELIDRLVARDIIKKIGEKKARKLTFEERLEAEEPLREKYSIEFEQNG
ncbi:MAG: hypothetical protein ACE5GV_10055, partial [Candidatus Scalindua sp.]